MALYFECRINKNVLLQMAFLGDFVHWAKCYYLNFKLLKDIVREVNLMLIVTK